MYLVLCKHKLIGTYAFLQLYLQTLTRANPLSSLTLCKKVHSEAVVELGLGKEPLLRWTCCAMSTTIQVLCTPACQVTTIKLFTFMLLNLFSYHSYFITPGYKISMWTGPLESFWDGAFTALKILKSWTCCTYPCIAQANFSPPPPPPHWFHRHFQERLDMEDTVKFIQNLFLNEVLAILLTDGAGFTQFVKFCIIPYCLFIFPLLLYGIWFSANINAVLSYHVINSIIVWWCVCMWAFSKHGGIQSPSVGSIWRIEKRAVCHGSATNKIWIKHLWFECCVRNPYQQSSNVNWTCSTTSSKNIWKGSVHQWFSLQ